MAWQWLAALLAAMSQVQPARVIGPCAMVDHWPLHTRTSTQAVQAWRSWGPPVIPLLHPSPRNNGWLKRNARFELGLLPVLRNCVAAVLNARG